MRKSKNVTIKKSNKIRKKQKLNIRNTPEKKISIHKKSIKKKRIISIDIPVVTISDPTKRPRKRRSKNGTNSKMYFTQDTEDAIIEYNNTIDIITREKIFEDKIHQPFIKLVENVFNTFKFSYFKTSSQDAQKECLTHLVANIHKFDPSRQSKVNPNKKAKAFAYFSIIAKHYLILLNNTNHKEFNQNIEISDERDENTIQLQQSDKHYVQQEMNDFIQLLIEFWEKNINKIFTKQRDLNIANAVIELFRNGKNISMFNKKALYLYIRELSQCKTQQITKVINKMRIFYDKIRCSYENDGIINTDYYDLSRNSINMV